MSQVAEFRGRGIQEVDVFAAADALLAEGKRPTIERVRLKIGRGSPNTVSPMLERWFATLGERLVGTQARSEAAAGNDPDDMPVGVRNAAKLLWKTARREAEEVQRGELASVRSELQAREDALVAGQDTLVQREEAFVQARQSLEAALTSSQQVREALERQLKEHTLEAQRMRTGLEGEVRRLTTLLSQSAEMMERMRQEHAESLAAKDQDLRQAEERHAQQNQRLLLEVDRARQSSKALEAALAREQQQRVRAEEGAAQRLAAIQDSAQQQLQRSRTTEATLRDQLATQAVELAQAKGHAASARQEVQALHSLLEDEKRTHDATRALLAQALPIAPKPRDGRRSKRSAV